MPQENKIKGRTLPNNLEAEQSLLSCLLVDAELAVEIAPTLSPDDFYAETHKQIFTAMQEINRRTKPIELSTLTDQLERSGMMSAVGGMSYLATLSTLVPSSANYKYYLDIIKRNSVMRRLIHECADIISEAYTSEDGEKTVSIAEKKIFDINQNNLSGAITPLSESVAEVFKRAEKMQNDPKSFRGVMTGFRDFDKKTNGFQKGNLIILAATTGVGKSAMAVNIAEHAGKNDKVVAYFSLEMPKREIAQRLLSSLSEVSMTKMTTGKLDKERDWTKLWEAAELSTKMQIYIDDSSVTTPAEIRSKCIRIKAKYGLDLVIVDYLQLMSLTGKKVESRQLEIAEITRNLKIIAKELDVPIIALSQLSREAQKRNVKDGGEPVLSDLRESGAIEQDADMVLFIYRKHDTQEQQMDVPTEVEFIIAKNRNGPTDRVTLKWIGELVRFVNFDDKLANGQINKSEKTDTVIDQAPLPENAPPEERQQPRPDETLDF